MIYACAQPREQFRLAFLLVSRQSVTFFWILCLIDFINVSISNLYVYVYLYTRTVTHSFTHPFLLNAHILHSHTRAHIQRISNWIAFGVLENPQAQTTWKLTFLSVLLFHSFTFPANKKRRTNERTWATFKYMSKYLFINERERVGQKRMRQSKMWNLHRILSILHLLFLFLFRVSLLPFFVCVGFCWAVGSILVRSLSLVNIRNQ